MLDNQNVEEPAWVSKKKAKVGVYLFFIYLFFYAGFVCIGVVNYELLALIVFKGVNLAIIYGVGLILFAVILGVIYNYLCNKIEKQGALGKEALNDI